MKTLEIEIEKNELEMIVKALDHFAVSKDDSSISNLARDLETVVAEKIEFTKNELDLIVKALDHYACGDDDDDSNKSDDSDDEITPSRLARDLEGIIF